jgi:hypothetical protein
MLLDVCQKPVIPYNYTYTHQLAQSTQREEEGLSSQTEEQDYKHSVPDKIKTWEEKEDREVTESFMQTVCPARHLHTHTKHIVNINSVLISAAKEHMKLQP